jgi:hypothetical protein
MLLAKFADDSPSKMHMTVFAQGNNVPDDFQLFPDGSDEPTDLVAAGKDVFQMSLTKGGSSHTAAANVLDASNPLKKKKQVTKKVHSVDEHSSETKHETTEVAGSRVLRTSHTAKHITTDKGPKMMKNVKQKSKPRTLRHLMSVEDELDDDTGFDNEETLVDLEVGVDDDGMRVAASNNINLNAGTGTNIVTGAPANNNTAIQQTSSTFEVTVSGAEVVGGRRLLADERKVSLFRLVAFNWRARLA